jgi:antitoxin ParD1/3/4
MNDNFGVYPMNISLTPDLEKFVQQKVASGLYTSASEVIRESLRLMFSHDDQLSHCVTHLNQAIDIGLQQLKKGQRVNAQEAYKRFKQKIDHIKTKK